MYSSAFLVKIFLCHTVTFRRLVFFIMNEPLQILRTPFGASSVLREVGWKMFSFVVLVGIFRCHNYSVWLVGQIDGDQIMT